MNILPKKRWHVRTKDNIARVRRDEAKAAEEEKRAKERIALAEQEFRTKLLRQKAVKQRTTDGIVIPSTIKGEEVEIQTESGHINFFADLEKQEKAFGTNKEYEQEKKLQREDEERKIGVLKFLGEGSCEYMKDAPWWAKAPVRLSKEEKTPKPSSSSSTVLSFRDTLPSSTQESNPRITALRSSTKCDKGLSRPRREKRKKEKREKRKEKRKSRKSSSVEAAAVSDSEKRDSLKVLREQRLKREAEERTKAENLLRKLRGETQPTTSGNKPSVVQKFNSQFNPEFARQNQDDYRPKRF